MVTRVEKGGKSFGLGCDPVVGSLIPAKKKDYKVTNRLQEGKRPLYAIVFNTIDFRYRDIFATVGGNKPLSILFVGGGGADPRLATWSIGSSVTVYQCLDEGDIAVLQSYADEDKNESFYTVGWACNVDGTPLVVAGGLNGVIRVIDAGSEKIHKDESIRLWNAHTGICILIFAGGGGHRNEVLSVDFHPSDMYRICSCGMDSTVKIWSMKEFWTYVEKSSTWTDLPSKFPTKFVQFPVYTASVHINYVDCNRWLGDFILSKSVDNEIILWEPKVNEQTPGKGVVDVLHKYPIPDCNIWFIKFSCDFHFNIVTVGNREGKIFVWELQSSPPVLAAKLSHPQSKSPIRQTATSFDGSTILSCCEDGTIWRWDVSKPSTSTSTAA
ncbi:Polycomb group protein FIE1 [Glycine max]|nr:Polycomb group protein FIE1 [Glycine max]